MKNFDFFEALKASLEEVATHTMRGTEANLMDMNVKNNTHLKKIAQLCKKRNE